MGLRTYQELLRIRAVRQIVILTVACRTPLWAGTIVITLHVVGHLHRSYAMAGLVTAVQMVMLGISSPIRGRRLDELGLRRALVPSFVVLGVCWGTAPWVGYWAFLGLAGLASLFNVPTFSIARAVLINNTALSQRTAVLSLDGILSDLTFMVGPVLGVLLATSGSTPVALFVCQLGSLAAAGAIWLADPPLKAKDDTEQAAEPAPARRIIPAWLNSAAGAALAVAAVGTFILMGEELSTVAAMRHWRTPGSTGWMLAVWAVGSLAGGLVYGMLRRHPRAAILLAALAASTALVALAPGRAVFAVLLAASGALAAPTITATADELSRAIPVRNRGEAMGWHGTATTAGNALGAPVVGIALDGLGWRGGLLATGLGALLVAVAGLAVRPAAVAPTGPGRSGKPE